MIHGARRSPSGLAVFPGVPLSPIHQDRNAMKAAAKAGLDRFLIYRMHAPSSFLLGEITLPEARVIASVGSFGPFAIMDLAKQKAIAPNTRLRLCCVRIAKGCHSP
jgi:hypothetical protein